MQSPTSLTCRPLRYFGAAALHNRALRIIGLLRITAKGRVRKGDSARTGPCRIGTCTAERETAGTTANSGAESRSSSGLYPAGTSKAEGATQNSAHGVRNPSGEDDPAA